MTRHVAIMGNGPVNHLPDLTLYKDSIDVWIGADKGALTLIQNEIIPDYALGDFDSTDKNERIIIRENALSFQLYPAEKDQTDLEIALDRAFSLHPDKISFFGVTGGRQDHTFVNIQLLYSVVNRSIKGIIVDKQNQMELTLPGRHTIIHDELYPNISFIPFTPLVNEVTLEGFYYPLTAYSLAWGSTRCISNKLIKNCGTFSYKEGILLLIKSCDEKNDTIPT